MKKYLKLFLAPAIIVVTLAVFGRFVATHPKLVVTLRHTNPWLAVGVIGVYIVGFLVLAALQNISLEMVEKPVEKTENVLLTAYSTLVNFFGPGQSGPGFRAIYLKKRHGVNFKDFIFVTLIYYGFYAVISATMLAIGSRPWWQTVLGVLASGGASLGVIKLYRRKSKTKHMAGINPKTLAKLFAATTLQLAVQATVYFLELRSVDPHISISQVVTYAGAANFSLFAALTPGAIGIREAFLVFSQRLHHISNADIVAANVLDRAIYLVFLGLLFALIIVTHAKKQLRVKQIIKEGASEQ